MKYIFIHIPKTAGSAFFKEVISPHPSQYYYGYKKIEGKVLKNNELVRKNLPIEKLSIENDYDIFIGHMPYGLHHSLSTTEYMYITILRHPVEKFISFYNYFVQRGKTSSSVSISAFSKQYFHLRQEMIDKMAGYMYKPGEIPNEKNITLALENIKKDSTIFGFTESYNDFLTIVNKKIGWKVNNRIINKTKFHKFISEKEKEEIAELCFNDIQFYNECLEIYKEKYKNILVGK